MTSDEGPSMPVVIEATKPMNLRQKLAAVRRKVHNVEKRGHNAFHNYDYARAEDIAGALGNELAELNVIVERRNLQWLRSQVEKSTVMELTCEYGFIDGDSDEEIWQPAYGEGRDTGDKAAYKAFTGALKYYLVQAFLLATGDDPENDSEEDRDSEARACTKCGVVGAIIKQKPEYGKGWYCFPKMGGCGATFPEDHNFAQPSQEGPAKTQKQGQEPPKSKPAASTQAGKKQTLASAADVITGMGLGGGDGEGITSEEATWVGAEIERLKWPGGVAKVLVAFGVKDVNSISRADLENKIKPAFVKREAYLKSEREMKAAGVI